MSAQEQLFIYLLNRARHDPAAYQAQNQLSVDLSRVAAQMPLAVNDKLVASAQFHAQEMGTHDYFAHQSQVTGDMPNKMVRDQGYALPSSWSSSANYVESLAAGYPDAASALRALIVDDGVPSLGHRIHLLAMDSFFSSHREIGAGLSYDPSATYRYYLAAHTAYANPTDLFLTGVVYNDANGDGLYSLNEGLGGVTVTSGGTTTVTNAAGGWSIAVHGSGTYTVTTHGGAFVGTATAQVAVGAANVEVDFASGHGGGAINFGAMPAAINHAPVLTAMSGQTMTHSQASLQLNLTATDADSDAITYAAAAVNPTYAVKQQFGLGYAGNYYYNRWGRGEKWLLGTGNTWYTLTANGQLMRASDWKVMATVDPSCWTDPSRLWNAQSAVPVTVSIVGNRLTLTPATSFVGSVVVNITASDGKASDAKSFALTVNNSPAPQVSTQTPAVTLAHQVKQQLGLAYAGNYYLNRWRLNEKWLVGTGNTWYYLLPNGQLIRSRDRAVMGAFGAAIYLDPSRLWNA